MTQLHALIRGIVIIIISGLLSGTAMADSRLFAAYDLNVDGRQIDYVVEDVNADGLKDVLFFCIKETPETISRYFSVFYQTENGFNVDPDETFEVDADAIVFDIADVDRAKGKEILFFTKKGLFYYKQDLGHYKKSPQHLLKADSIFKGVDRFSLAHFDFARDLNNDGTDEILIPRFDDYFLYRQDRAGNYIFNTKLDIRVQSRIAASDEFSPYLVPSFITPNIVITDYNRDQRDDIIVVQNNYLRVFFQNEAGSFYNSNAARIDLGFEITPAYSLMFLENPRAGNAWQKEKIGMKYLQDINNDGWVDIIIERFSLKDGAFSQKKQYEIFFGQPFSEDASKGGRFNETPDHVISNDQYQPNCVVLDLNQDKKQDIIVPVIETGFFKIIAMLISGKMDVTAQVFLLNDSGGYSKKPDDTYDFSMKLDRTGKMIPVISYAGDFNGDGRRDFLTNDDNNLLIYYGSEKELIQDKPGVEYPAAIPDDGSHVKPAYLNADTKSDIVIVYPEKMPGKPAGKSGVRILMAR